jgi:hypothetical protein
MEIRNISENVCLTGNYAHIHHMFRFSFFFSPTGIYLFAFSFNFWHAVGYTYYFKKYFWLMEIVFGNFFWVFGTLFWSMGIYIHNTSMTVFLVNGKISLMLDKKGLRKR